MKWRELTLSRTAVGMICDVIGHRLLIFGQSKSVWINLFQEQRCCGPYRLSLRLDFWKAVVTAPLKGPNAIANCCCGQSGETTHQNAGSAPHRQITQMSICDTAFGFFSNTAIVTAAVEPVPSAS